jgi:hypothetical protein
LELFLPPSVYRRRFFLYQKTLFSEKVLQKAKDNGKISLKCYMHFRIYFKQERTEFVYEEPENFIHVLGRRHASVPASGRQLRQ